MQGEVFARLIENLIRDQFHLALELFTLVFPDAGIVPFPSPGRRLVGITSARAGVRADLTCGWPCRRADISSANEGNLLRKFSRAMTREGAAGELSAGVPQFVFGAVMFLGCASVLILFLAVFIGTCRCCLSTDQTSIFPGRAARRAAGPRPAGSAAVAMLKPPVELLDPGASCSICHELLERGHALLELECKHCYHDDCIRAWLGRADTCPVCRSLVIRVKHHAD